MTDVSCKWAGSDRPRIVGGRHENGCNDETCRGCQPCTEPHCRVCGRTHAEGACAECLAEVRSNLREVARLCDALPAEVEHRGVEGEAMMLLGPATDPEAWGHREASILSGRLVHPDCDARELEDVKAWLERANDERHPLTVLGTWRMVYESALDHESDEVLTIANATDYIDRNLTYFGGYEHVAFEDMARDLRRCTTYLLRVLHDQNEGDRANVGCFECGGDLERRLTTQGFEDFWTCTRCRRRYTAAEYNFALRAAIEDQAETTEVVA